MLKGVDIVGLFSGGILLQAAAEGNWFSVLFPFILMFAIFYFLLIRPQQRQQKRRQEMLNSLRRGQKVVTVGGIHGEITGIKDDVVTVRIAEKVEIKLNKAGVGVVKGEETE